MPGISDFAQNIIADRFELLGKFTGGIVYARDCAKRCDHEFQELVLIKSTDLSTKEQLLREVEVYHALGSRNNAGFPVLLWFGEWDGVFCFAMDYRGCSLERLRFHIPEFFDPRTVAMFAMHMLNRIRHLHAIGFIHGDIKPDNFTLGPIQAGYSGKRGLANVNLINFGSAIRIKEGRKETLPRASNPAFASIRALRGEPLAKVDDLESLAYTLIYLLVGDKVPWIEQIYACLLQGKYGRRRMLTIKSEIIPEMICRDYPPVYAQFLRYTRELDASIEPDYIRFIKEFKFTSKSR